jgi:hypothetical protein
MAPLADKVVEDPVQRATFPLVVIVGNGFTVTVTIAKFVHPVPICACNRIGGIY